MHIECDFNKICIMIAIYFAGRDEINDAINPSQS